MNLKKFTLKEFEISLPETYIGGDPWQERKALSRAVKALPAGHRPLLQQYFSQALFSFMAADTSLRDGQRVLTTCSVNIIKTPSRYVGMSPQELLDIMSSQLNGETDLQESGLAEFSGFHAVRLVSYRRKTKSFFGINFGMGTRINREKTEAEKSLTYIFTHGGKYICVIFTAQPEVFGNLLPVFEESVRSFKLL